MDSKLSDNDASSRNKSPFTKSSKNHPHQESQTPKEFAMMIEENNNNNNENINNNESSPTSNQYLATPRASSRSSSGLSSSECDDLDESSCPSSGRSSTAKRDYLNSSSTSGAEDSSSSPEPTGNFEQLSLSEDQEPVNTLSAQLNQHSNLIPATNQVNQAVDQVRVKFLEELKLQNLSESCLYEESDLKELRKALPAPEQQHQSLAFRMISRYMRFEDNQDLELSQDKIMEISEKLKDFLKYRHQYQVPSVRSDQFCKEIFLLHGIFPFGHDRQNLPVLYLRARVHRRWSVKFDEAFRRYVAWQIDTITKSYSGAQVHKAIGRNCIEKDGSFGICFDCLSVSYSCVDMDFLRFLVRLLVNYYPTYCRYALCVDLPWLFRSVWKLVRSWLPEEAQNTVQLITSKQLTEFIHEDQIPNSIRIDDDRNRAISEKRKHILPADYQSIRDFDEFAKELQLGSSEVKSFRSHLEKVLKEYKQLGAL